LRVTCESPAGRVCEFYIHDFSFASDLRSTSAFNLVIEGENGTGISDK